MTKTIESRKLAMESSLSQLAGFAVELTVRGDRDFTLSADGCKCDELQGLVAKIGGKLSAGGCSYDAECDFTCAYFIA